MSPASAATRLSGTRKVAVLLAVLGDEAAGAILRITALLASSPKVLVNKLLTYPGPPQAFAASGPPVR